MRSGQSCKSGLTAAATRPAVVMSSVVACPAGSCEFEERRSAFRSETPQISWLTYDLTLKGVLDLGDDGGHGRGCRPSEGGSAGGSDSRRPTCPPSAQPADTQRPSTAIIDERGNRSSGILSEHRYLAWKPQTTRRPVVRSSPPSHVALLDASSHACMGPPATACPRRPRALTHARLIRRHLSAVQVLPDQVCAQMLPSADVGHVQGCVPPRDRVDVRGRVQVRLHAHDDRQRGRRRRAVLRKMAVQEVSLA